MWDKEYLKECMFSEGAGSLSDELFEEFLSKGEMKEYGPDIEIISPGSIDKALYVIASGVTKVFYFDGRNEVILGFGGVGTFTLSPLGYIMDKPAFCGFKTITKCDILKIRESDLNALLESSHEFAIWMFRIAMAQICALELKVRMFNEGDIISNYKKMVKEQMHPGKNEFQTHRENLLNIVSSKDIASYLGITQSYLSNIRKAIIDQERKK